MDCCCKWGQGINPNYIGIQKEKTTDLFIKVLVCTLLTVMKLGFLLISIKISNWWVKLIIWNCIVGMGNYSLLINLTVTAVKPWLFNDISFCFRKHSNHCSSRSTGNFDHYSCNWTISLQKKTKVSSFILKLFYYEVKK